MVVQGTAYVRESARPSRSFIATILIVSLFFMWGVANNLNDILIKQFGNAFELSDFQAGLVQSAFYFGYFCFAIPAAIFMRRAGYKSGVVIGLILYAAGAFLFWPAGEAHSYPFFLGALFVIACGLTFLETSANPLIAAMGPEETAARRLNFAQAFNPLGSIAGVLIGRQFIFSEVEYAPEQIALMAEIERQAYFVAEAKAVQMPYLLIGLVVMLWAAMIFAVNFPAVDERDAGAAEGTRFFDVLKRKRLSGAVLAQFFYVGAQVGIWSYLIRYAQEAVPGMAERTAADYLTAALVAFLAGRFISTGLMRFIPPRTMLIAYSLINAALMAYAVAVPDKTGLLALVASSFFMSIMYPTIFAAGIRGLGPLTKPGASLIVMAIIGGAVLTAAMGQLSDLFGIHAGFVIPLLAFAIVAAFGFMNRMPVARATARSA